jgi:hypothetical protein
MGDVLAGEEGDVSVCAMDVFFCMARSQVSDV